jgi:membrane protease YdiL (CAAX protease family)
MISRKELIDQSAHFGSCLGLSLIGLIPVIGSIALVWLFAISREYYQHKSEHLEFVENIYSLKFFNLDMKWNWVGIVVGAVINGGVCLFIFRSVMV